MAKLTILRITAKRDGRRRAGIDHPASPVDHPLDVFSKEQIEQLKSDDLLVVQELEIDVPDEKPTGGRGGKAAS
ncbi:MAG: HI1506-related protein [Pigmentiphaga sp.]|nr:HI1506-related protein [Pigmentiphaga sp.]